MIIAASEQMTELLEELGLAARIEGERYEPVLAEVDTLELARAAVPEADGTGTTVDDGSADGPALARRARRLRARSTAAFPRSRCTSTARTLTLEPVNAAAAPVIMGEELKDLGAAVAVRAIRALGGSVELDGERLLVRLA